MNLYDQVQRYLNAIPGAISGKGGHDATYHVACELVHGFDLSESDVSHHFSKWNQTCSPPWTVNELQHKITEAAKATNHDKPKGWRINSYQSQNQNVCRSVSVASEAILGPDPIPQGLVKLLEVAFEVGEGVSIAGADFNDEQKSVPNAGITLSREDWLKRLSEKDNDPNQIFAATGNPGAFIRINPMVIGKHPTDANVTAFRHVLIEFDNIPIPEQWQVITSSQAPCSAVIFSGSKSLHAWIKVDAKDRSEYDLRVRYLLKYFEKFEPDPKNKNPSRLSRLPDAKRGETFQSLLAVGIGAKSFDEWQQAHPLDDRLPKARLLSAFTRPPENDPDELLKDRFLCRGGTLILAGPTGIGKSSLMLQMLILWAIGRPCFEIEPAKELKALIIQAENDDGDMAEMRDGVMRGLNLSEQAQIDATRNILVVRETVRTGAKFFAETVEPLLQTLKPDLVVVDPALSYLGGDNNSQVDVGSFTRNGFNPLLLKYNCGLILLHHTNKPPSKQENSAWNVTDFAYAGGGSSEWANWARSILVLKSTQSVGIFELKAGKRGGRLGWREKDGSTSYVKRIAHSKDPGMICWREPDLDEIPVISDKRKRIYNEVDLLVHVPIDVPIKKTDLRQKANAAGIPVNLINPLIGNLIDDQLLYEFSKARSGRRPELLISRKPQPEPALSI